MSYGSGLAAIARWRRGIHTCTPIEYCRVVRFVGAKKNYSKEGGMMPNYSMGRRTGTRL